VREDLFVFRKETVVTVSRLLVGWLVRGTWEWAGLWGDGGGERGVGTTPARVTDWGRLMWGEEVKAVGRCPLAAGKEEAC